jgi:hypothetical protein
VEGEGGVSYCIVQDNDSHSYVIPVERLADWSVWLQSEDAELGLCPAWADEVGGCPSRVVFESYRIG